ncbi:hypothetical protein PHLCEN_2v10329 [Hermanssonia centrifuga]|uniref:FAD-binding domain-containing protein n=1 Tax=Hermanssonia centrifuga TaxID=98765 RepID=A0A2R6NN79_9APHY|nr:hypothetical protein PHLCEN_2v10329 [Hermanssonia centrifuga]
MAASPAKELRIAIVGGGVCGLMCAIALAKNGITAQLYEAAAKFGEIGAGIGINPNAVRILRDIGVLNDVLAKTGSNRPNRTGWMQFRSGMQDSELVYDYTTLPGQESIGIHRAAFLDALVQHIDLKSCHFNKRCIRVSESPLSTNGNSELTIHFADSTSAEADVVLGADGIKSAVRPFVTGASTAEHVKFSNTICYRGLVPTEQAKSAGMRLDFSDRPMCFLGQDKHVIAFSIKGGHIINVVAFVSDRTVPMGEAQLPPGQPAVVPVPREQLMKEYEGWGSDVLALLSCIDKPDKWNIHVVYPPLQSYVKGRVALFGDAAHAMLPHLGAGSGQGLEDAHLLAKLLAHPQTSGENIETILQVYDEIRRPRTQSVWEGSMRAGEIYEGYGISGSSREGLRKDLEDLPEFVWIRELNQDMQDATARLQQLGVFTNED